MNYANGKREGAYKINYESNKPKESGTYKDDKIIGDVTVLHENGAKLADLHYTQDGNSGGRSV